MRAASVEVGLGEAALGVGGERQADLVPAVDEDVGVVVGLLGQFGHAVDEGDRGGEVGELPLALDGGRRQSVPRPRGASETCLDLRRRSSERHRRGARLASPAGERVQSVHADREPRPPRHRAAVRARRRRGRARGHARVRLPARGAGARAPHARRAAGGPQRRARSTRRCASGRSNGEAIYELDREALAELDPELIVTQALCPVCAVSYEEVQPSSRASCPPSPQVVALDPKTLGETLGTCARSATATGPRAGGARSCSSRPPTRIDAVAHGRARAPARPRVLALEWLDPVFVAGHWTPQLIELAGGEDVLGLRRGALAGARLGGAAGGAAGDRGGDALRLRRCHGRRRRRSHTRRRARRAGGTAGRGGGRRGLLLETGAAADRRPRAAGPHPAPGARARERPPGARALEVELTVPG